MSVGFFIGVRRSFIDEAQDSAEAFLQAINVELARLGLPLYQEPQELPNVYKGPLFGRSALDHDSARLIVELARRAVATHPSPHLELLSQNPYRVAFVPHGLSLPVETRFEDRIGGESYPIWCGSAQGLWQEIVACAPVFGIPLVAGSLHDDTARRINEYEALDARAPPDAELANLRTTWLTVHEAARLSVATDVALCLAG